MIHCTHLILFVWHTFLTCDRKWTDSIVAVSVGVVVRLRECLVHHLGGNEWRVQVDRPWWSGEKMGREKEQTKHELWQVVKSFEVLLWQEHYDQSSWQEVCIQVWLSWIGSGLSAKLRRPSSSPSSSSSRGWILQVSSVWTVSLVSFCLSSSCDEASQFIPDGKSRKCHWTDIPVSLKSLLGSDIQSNLYSCLCSVSNGH